MENKYKILLISSLALLSQSILAADIYCPDYVICGVDNNCAPVYPFPVKLYQQESPSVSPGKYIFVGSGYSKDKGTTCMYNYGIQLFTTISRFVPDSSVSNRWINFCGTYSCFPATDHTQCPFINS